MSTIKHDIFQNFEGLIWIEVGEVNGNDEINIRNSCKKRLLQFLNQQACKTN
jgi:hypothetical protein